MPGHIRTKSADFEIIVFGHVDMLSGVCFCIACIIIGVFLYLGAIYSCHGVKVMQGHACQDFMDHFSCYNYNFLAICCLRSIVYNNMNAIFELSAYEYSICDPPRFKVIQGHMRLLT